MSNAPTVDVLIFGGGAAGLWALDTLTRNGFGALLLEAHALGTGQTIASQGIIHGGLKYTLAGALTGSAQAIRDMPHIWRECLAGRGSPDLRRTVVRAQFCHLWRTESVSSKLAMIGARMGLRVAPRPIRADERPAALANCPGTVARLDEQVIDPATFLADLAQQHRDRILKIDIEGLRMSIAGDGCNVHMACGKSGAAVAAQRVILTAGAGNAALRERLGLSPSVMQRRPLHMAMVRGRGLPPLFGHCVDGLKTRVTITSAIDSAGRTVWYIGGQLAEEGAGMQAADLVAHAQSELRAVLGGLDLGAVEWAAHRVDRAEAGSGAGARPDDVGIVMDAGDRVITAWPTKLALAPRLAQRIASIVQASAPAPMFDASRFADWPRPQIADPPWEMPQQWSADP